MSKKIIILSIIAFIVVVGAVVGTLWFINNNPWATNTKVDPTAVVPDLTEDYGACNMLTKDQIVSALGSSANNLGDAYNSGRIFSQGDTRSQFCRFSLGDNAETSNFKSMVTIYSQQHFIDDAAKAFNDDTTVTKVAVNGNDGFFYIKKDELQKTERFELTFYKGMNQYTFTLTQPLDSTMFNESSAKTALTTLAGEAKLTQ